METFLNKIHSKTSVLQNGSHVVLALMTSNIVPTSWYKHADVDTYHIVIMEASYSSASIRSLSQKKNNTLGKAQPFIRCLYVISCWIRVIDLFVHVELYFSCKCHIYLYKLCSRLISLGRRLSSVNKSSSILKAGNDGPINWNIYISQSATYDVILILEILQPIYGQYVFLNLHSDGIWLAVPIANRKVPSLSLRATFDTFNHGKYLSTSEGSSYY